MSFFKRLIPEPFLNSSKDHNPSDEVIVENRSNVSNFVDWMNQEFEAEWQKTEPQILESAPNTEELRQRWYNHCFKNFVKIECKKFKTLPQNEEILFSKYPHRKKKWIEYMAKQKDYEPNPSILLNRWIKERKKVFKNRWLSNQKSRFPHRFSNYKENQKLRKDLRVESYRRQVSNCVVSDEAFESEWKKSVPAVLERAPNAEKLRKQWYERKFSLFVRTQFKKLKKAPPLELQSEEIFFKKYPFLENEWHRIKTKAQMREPTDFVLLNRWVNLQKTRLRGHLRAQLKSFKH